MSVLIFDSNCELWHTRAEELGLDYISMPYSYGDREYFYDLGKTTDLKEFYAAVRSGAVPKTRALKPEDYKKILTPYFEKGEDVLYISFSHKMSGTFIALDVALQELKEKYRERKCTVFDTRAICIGALPQVEAAAALKKQGKTDGEIIGFLNEFTNKVSVYFTVGDLIYLKRGGRLSATKAAAGRMLRVKPILTFDGEGGLCVKEKVVGRHKAIKRLAGKVAKGLTHPEYTVYIADADCLGDAKLLSELIKKKRPDAKIVHQPIGPVIGSHCGPDTLVVSFISDKRPIPLNK